MSRVRNRRRTDSRQAKRDRAQVSAPLVQPSSNLPIYQILTPANLEIIHQRSMQILSEIGILFMDDPESLDILRDHGVEIRDEVAYFDSALIAEYVAKAPSQFTQLARNPERNVVVGGDHLCFAPVYGPPFVLDLEQGRRDATLEDFQNFVKLAYLSPYLHHSGGTIVEPTDVPAPTRHLDMLYSHIKYSDKPFMGSVMSAEGAADSVAIAEILFGAEAIREQPALISLINISSPRRLDDRMLGALKVYARARQALIITPFVLSGAMAPVSVAATLAQQNAEALAGIAFAQMVNRGRRWFTAHSRPTSICKVARRSLVRPRAKLHFMSALSWRAATTCPSAAAACSPALRCRCASRLRIGDDDVARRAWPASILCCTPPAGWRED